MNQRSGHAPSRASIDSLLSLMAIKLCLPWLMILKDGKAWLRSCSRRRPEGCRQSILAHVQRLEAASLAGPVLFSHVGLTVRAVASRQSQVASYNLEVTYPTMEWAVSHQAFLGHIVPSRRTGPMTSGESTVLSMHQYCDTSM